MSKANCVSNLTFLNMISFGILNMLMMSKHYDNIYKPVIFPRKDESESVQSQNKENVSDIITK